MRDHEAFEKFKGTREWSHTRPCDPACADLGPIEYEIRHAGGTLGIDPNTLAVLSQDLALGDVHALVATHNMRLAGYSEDMAGKSLKDLEPVPGLTSVISGEPAVLFRNSEAQFGLTTDELRALGRRSLSSEQFFKLCDAVGAIWEVHDDFYDPETGNAFQSMDADVSWDEENNDVPVTP